MEEEAEHEPVAPREPHRLRELSRVQRAVAAATIGLLAVAAGLLVQTMHAESWTQVGDEANQIHGAQLAFTDWPLVGDLTTANLYGNPVSHHPGPIAWYALAPWVLLLGPQLGGWLFAVAVNLGSIVLGGWFAYRSAGSRAGLVALVALPIAYTAAVPESFSSAFFQFVVLLPLGAALICCWAAARGDTLALPFAVLGATFAVQSATLGLPLLVCTGAAACVSLALELRSGRAAPRHRWIHLGAAAAVLVVTWWPALWDQVRGSGNLMALARADIPHVGLPGVGDFVRELTRYLAAPPLIWLGLALVFLVATLRPRRFVADRPLAIVVVAALVGGSITAALLPVDDVEETHLLWIPMVTAFLVVAATAWGLSGQRLRPRTGVLGVAVALLALLPAVADVRAPELDTLADEQAALAVDAVTPDVLADLPPGPVQLTHRGAYQGTRLAQGLLPRLEAAGHRRSFLTSELVDFDGTTLVAMPGQPVTWGDGRVIAEFQPEPDPRAGPDLAAEVDAFARSTGPLVLRPHAEEMLTSLIDGQVASACVADLVARPDDLLDVHPEMAAVLYSSVLVQSPALPPDLVARLDPWRASRPLSVVELPAHVREDEGLLFTEPSC